MKELVVLLAGLAAVFGLVYLLYSNGVGVINAKAALVYQGSLRLGKNKNRVRASFVSCRGTTKRVVRLEPGKEYRFVFSAVVSRGAVSVELRDRQSDTLVVLDQQHPAAILSAGPRGRLQMTTRFEKADGTYELSWNPAE